LVLVRRSFSKAESGDPEPGATTSGFPLAREWAERAVGPRQRRQIDLSAQGATV